MLPKRAHGLVVVTDGERALGTVSEADAAGVDRFAQVHQVMNTDFATVSAGTDPEAVFDQLASQHRTTTLVLDGERLAGVLTSKGALRATLYSPALDPSGALLVGT